jgi:hypothetical protein
MKDAMQTRSFRGWVPALTGLCLVCASPAAGEGGLALTEVLEAVKSEPHLVSQIEVELRKRDLKVPEIVCIANRHGNQWRLLDGGRAAPYECSIGDRSLRIDAERVYFDANGRKLGQLGQAPDNLLFNRAKFFREGKFRWTWSP